MNDKILGLLYEGIKFGMFFKFLICNFISLLSTHGPKYSENWDNDLWKQLISYISSNLISIYHKFCMKLSKNYSNQWVGDAWMNRQIIEWTVRETEGNIAFSQPQVLLHKRPDSLTSSAASRNATWNIPKHISNKHVKQEGSETSGKYLRKWLLTKDSKMTWKLASLLSTIPFSSSKGNVIM